RKNERIYLGLLEVYREYALDGETIALERETLMLSLQQDRFAVIETRTQGAADPAPAQLVRYQHANHLGSIALELDATGDIISYEEYFAYGSTSYQAVRSHVETPKRFRYTGQERDEETDFYYHDRRYYAPWLGRWTAQDPAGAVDGTNLYVYCRNN